MAAQDSALSAELAHGSSAYRWNRPAVAGDIGGVAPQLGLISYSVYLWQQLSTGAPDQYGANTLLLVPLLFLVPAVLSYALIEKPIIKLGHRWSDAIKRRACPLHVSSAVQT